ncbi:MAG: protein kinase [Planctomycetes bacterium]|nr:protein kinase [Planctomycetota bacterium]
MDDELESLVADFVLAREANPELGIEDHLAAHPARAAELRAALTALCEVEAALPEPPTRLAAIGPYRLGQELGRGASGVVYAVEHGGQQLALKWLSGALLAGPHAHARFARECSVLARLEHPGIVRIVDHGEFGGFPYLLMERVDGDMLGAVRLDTETALRVMHDLALAVGAAHDAGVVHRDLKPANVMLRSDGRPVVLDFGLSSCATEASLTGSGAVLGTPRYMAPEQARAERADARSDVFALGVLLYELLTGSPARRAADREGLLREAAAGLRLRLPKVDGWPPDLDRIVAHATALRPAWRYATASELAADLGRFRNGLPVVARPPGAILRAVDRFRRQRVTVVSLLLGVALVVFAVAHRSGGGPAEPSRVRAARLYRDGRFAEAVTAFREALVEAPDDPVSWGGLARAHLRLAQHQAGLEAADRALALGDGRDESLRNLRAVLLDLLGRGDEAQAVLVALCEEHPRDERYLFNLAHSFDASGRVRQAHDRYVELLGLAPDHRLGKASLAWLCATATDEFADLRDHDRATRLCMELLAAGAGADPAVLQTIVDLARIVGRNDEFGAALARAAEDSSLSDLQRRRLVDQARAIRAR